MTQVSVLPSWFKQRIPDSNTLYTMRQSFRGVNLHTVCQSARCPNIGQCWERGVATFMILGNTCTRTCRFCAVDSGRPEFLNENEPFEVARAVKRLKLRYVVITSVTRDDLDDGGAAQFAKTIEEIRERNPGTKIEVLIPDFSGKEECFDIIVRAGPDVIGHNMETVERLSSQVRPQANYRRSLNVLRSVRMKAPDTFIKSGFMVGLGEMFGEIKSLMSDLYETGCQILTIGQYLCPTQTKRHVAVERYVPLKEFSLYKSLGERIGFQHVMSAPLVRSSYLAEEGYKKCMNSIALCNTDERTLCL